MAKNDKIHVKIELGKNKTGDLTLTAHFDSNAPNYKKEKDEIKWYPTVEEIDFINQAFDLIPEYKSTGQHFSNKQKPTTETKAPSKEETLPEEKIDKTPTPVKDKEEENLNRIPVPPQKPELESDTKNSETTPNEPSFEPVDEPTDDKATPDLEDDTEKEDEKILVEADENTIDSIVKKQTGDPEEDDGLLVEADENTIIDRVLKQKKKGKWSKR